MPLGERLVHLVSVEEGRGMHLGAGRAASEAIPKTTFSLSGMEPTGGSELSSDMVSLRLSCDEQGP